MSEKTNFELLLENLEADSLATKLVNTYGEAKDSEKEAKVSELLSDFLNSDDEGSVNGEG